MSGSKKAKPAGHARKPVRTVGKQVVASSSRSKPAASRPKPVAKAAKKASPATPAAARKPRPALVQLSADEVADLRGQLSAISKSQAIIEFDLDGHVLYANDNFLDVVGYSLADIQGKHHSLFVPEVLRGSAEYRAFWSKLARGEYDAGQYKRLGRNGREIWLQASYNPILDASGKPFKVVKYATDITQQKLQAADVAGQLAAIDKAQAVIEFSLDGRILHANDNFLHVTGYTLEQVRGKHHAMFVDPDYRASVDYRLFWEKLGRGEYDSGQYRRIGNHGRELWLQATYNPILDNDGRPMKVVKFATDVTEQVQASQALEQAVAETREVISAARDGDLRLRIDLDGKSGAIESLCGGINELVEGMASLVRQLKIASGSISAAAQEIAAGNGDLSARTEQQAAALEETASSMEELTSTVRQNADNAAQANQLAINASGVARRGGEAMDGVVDTMSSIQQASRKVVDIISVIDGIAFQTNILALNAAVEAARAGEQGRGFAVVATEVRSLAQRSASAAKEIKQLINDSVERIATGGTLVDQAGKTMREIVASVSKVTDIMGEISAASQEQGSGIEQVGKAVVQMDETTQQNAALVEEMAASAKALEEQARGLVGAVSRYRIEAGAEPPASVAPMAPAAPVVSRPPSGIAERRNLATRPFSGKPAAPKPAVARGNEASTPPAQPPSRAANGGSWDEF